jgi:hypothetical protein
MSEETKSVGTAVYLELERNDGKVIYQMFFTPQGVSKLGKNVPPMLMFRQLTVARNKTKWTINSVQLRPVGADVYEDATKALELADKTINDHMYTLRQLSTQGYKLRKKAIHVAITPSDFDEMLASKTPYKILGRMERSRKVLGFPVEYVKVGV